LHLPVLYKNKLCDFVNLDSLIFKNQPINTKLYLFFALLNLCNGIMREWRYISLPYSGTIDDGVKIKFI
jgi:hypothetical protein